MNLGLKKVKEGNAEFFVPDDADRIYDSAVFYNPRMAMNRDLSILVTKAIASDLGRPICFLEMLSGSGVRGYRMLKETGEELEHVRMNDWSSQAAELMRHNLKGHPAREKVTITEREANALAFELAEQRQFQDVVDVDPFGTPAPFVQSALSVMRKRNGVVLVTATDMPPLCGIHRKAARRKYGVHLRKTDMCHEVAVRVLVGFVVREAAKLGFAVRPLFAFSADHYVRVVMQGKPGKQAADASLAELGSLYYCDGTGEYMVTKEPSHAVDKDKLPCCGSTMTVSGSMWLGDIVDESFVQQMIGVLENRPDLPSCKRLTRILSWSLAEKGLRPFYYDVHKQSDRADIPVPSYKWIIEELNKRGFYATRSAACLEGIKTNCSQEEFVEVLKEWTIT